MCGPRRHRVTHHKLHERDLHHTHHGLGVHGLVHHFLPRFVGGTRVQDREHEVTGHDGSDGPRPLTCLVCGAFNEAHARFCEACGIELHVCPISNAKFRLHDEFVQCPHCLSVFHKHHFEQWIDASTQPVCPVCRQELTRVYEGKVGVNQALS